MPTMNTINTINTAALEKRIAELEELEAFAKELDHEIESMKDEIKAVLIERNVEELPVGKYIVRFTNVITQRFDSTTFKKKLPELYSAYIKQVTSRRFTIS